MGGHKWNFDKKEGGAWGLGLLFAVVALILSVESKASGFERKVEVDRKASMATGSLIELMDDMDFGLSREKRYCGGQDAGFFRSLISDECCTMRINALDAPLNAQLIIKRGLRSVKVLDESGRYSVIEGKYEIVLNCGNSAPSASLLETAMGSRIKVHEVRTSPILQQALSKAVANISGLTIIDSEKAERKELAGTLDDDKDESKAESIEPTLKTDVKSESKDSVTSFTAPLVELI